MQSFINQGGAEDDPVTYALYLEFNEKSISASGSNPSGLRSGQSYYIYLLPYKVGNGFSFNAGTWF
jgi:hypothetical protein